MWFTILHWHSEVGEKEYSQFQITKDIFFFFNNKFEIHLFAFILRGRWNVAFMHDWITTIDEKYWQQGLNLQVEGRDGWLTADLQVHVLVVLTDGVAGVAEILAGIRELDVFQGERGHPCVAAHHNVSIKALQQRREGWLFPFMKPDIFRKWIYTTRFQLSSSQINILPRVLRAKPFSSHHPRHFWHVPFASPADAKSLPRKG